MLEDRTIASNINYFDKLNDYLGLVKTLQHTPRLSIKEKKLFDELLSITNSEDLTGPHEWSIIRSLLLPNNLMMVQLRIALRSMRRGTPTFLDQEIAIKFIDHLFRTQRIMQDVEAAANG